MPATRSRHLYLEQQGAILRERLNRIRRDRNRTDGPLDADFAEQAVQCENDEVLDRLEASVAHELLQIDRALAHLNRGRGDLCARCGKPIGEQRLAAVPYATQCAPCAHALAGEAMAVG